MRYLTAHRTISTTVLKMGSYQGGLLASKGADAHSGQVLPKNLGLQAQRNMDGAVGRDDSTGDGI